MNTQQFYLPINSNSLAHYFGRGLILPGRYYSNKVSDIQNRAGSALLISAKRWVKNSDCSLELGLTEKEEKSLVKISEHFYILQSPLPISRVKNIFFINNDQSKTTVWNINNGAAFIPEKLIKVDIPVDSNLIYENEILDFKEPEESADFARKAKYFDHLLGGFALMRIAGDQFMNYSQNYFYTLSFLNERIKQDIIKAQNENSVRFTEDYSGLLTKSDNKWGKWQSYFYQPINLSDVERIANDEGVNIQKRLGIPQLDNIDHNSILYDLVILATYGDGKNKSIDSFVSDILNDKVLSFKKEELSLIMGLNNGYAALRNRYKFANGSKTVKFELESQLDYYVIESIFQFAFNSVKNSSFYNYIDSWVAQSTEPKPSRNAYKVIDKWVVPKKKPKVFSPEYLEELFQSSANREIYKLISNAATNWFPPFVTKNETECLKYFEKAVKESFTKWQKDLLNTIKVDHESALEEIKEDMHDQVTSQEKLLREQIDALKNENSILRQEIEKSKVIPADHNVKEYGKSSVPENLVREAGPVELNYETLGVEELRKIAKEKHVKPIPKTKKDLIKAIKSANPLI